MESKGNQALFWKKEKRKIEVYQLSFNNTL